MKSGACSKSSRKARWIGIVAAVTVFAIACGFAFPGTQLHGTKKSVSLTGEPCQADLEEIYDAIPNNSRRFHYPYVRSYLDEYEVMYVHSQYGAGIYYYSGPEQTSQYKMPKMILEETEVIVAARQKSMSCVIFTSEDDIQRVGWVATKLLSYEGQRKTPSSEEPKSLTISEDQRIVVHRGWVLGLTDKGKVLVADRDGAWGSMSADSLADLADILGDDLVADLYSDDLMGPAFLDDWTDIVAIDAAVNGNKKTLLGLKKDGTVVSAGWNLSGECNVDGWTDIVQIEATIDRSYGLKADGTMVTAGDNSYGECNVGNITDGAHMYMGEHSISGIIVLNKDGSVESTGNQKMFPNAKLSSFVDMDEISLGWTKAYGVTKGGEVVSSEKLPTEIARWTDLRKVYFHNVHDSLIIGLHNDGTISAYTKVNYTGEEKIVAAVEKWTDINDIVILMDYSNFEKITVIGVKNDGSLVSTGGIDLTGFTDIRQLYVYDDSYTRFAYLVGVRNDGSVVSNDPDVKDIVAEWKLF